MKAVIFDLDGVLVHTDTFHYRAWKQTADEIGVPFDERVNERLRGVSRMDSLEIILERSPKFFSAAEKQELAERKNARYRRLLQGMTPADVTDEVRRTLALLGQTYRLAVGSSSRNARLILERTHLATAFDAVCDGTQIVRSKPDPEVFLKAARLLAVPPAECAVVEDAEAGLRAARAAGMMAVAYGSGTAFRADAALRAFADLPAVLRAFAG